MVFFGSRGYEMKIPKPRPGAAGSRPLRNTVKDGVQEWSYLPPVPPAGPAPSALGIAFEPILPKPKKPRKRKRNVVRFGRTSIIEIHARRPKVVKDEFDKITQLYETELKREEKIEQGLIKPKESRPFTKKSEMFIRCAVHNAMLCAIEAALETETLADAKRVMREVLGLAAYTAMVKAKDAEKALAASGRKRKPMRLSWIDRMVWD